MVEDSQGSGKGGGASEEDQGRSTDAGDDEGDDDGSMGERECRICHSCDDSGEGWISPCRCKGSGRWVHQECLQKWRMSSQRADSYHACELCQTEYTTSNEWWVTWLESKPVMLVATALSMFVYLAAGTMLWDALAVLFLLTCDNPVESFNFTITLFGINFGRLFGGVVMAKLGVIVLQLFRQDTPEVQNMVGFLAFIVFLVQSRVFSPDTSLAAAEPSKTATGSEPPVDKGVFKDLLSWGRFVPHYFLLVYSLSTTRWVYGSVRKVFKAALRYGTSVESFRGMQAQPDSRPESGSS